MACPVSGSIRNCFGFDKNVVQVISSAEENSSEAGLSQAGYRRRKNFDQRGSFGPGIAGCTGGDCAEKHVENDDTWAA
jgi:hypothetical protein